MGLRKRKDNSDSDSPKVLGLDPMGWLFVIISLVVGGITDAITFDAMNATAQKMENPEAFLGFLMVIVFAGSAGTLFALLSAVRKFIGW